MRLWVRNRERETVMRSGGQLVSRRCKQRRPDVRARDQVATLFGQAGPLVRSEVQAGQEGFLDPLEAAEPEGVGDAEVQETAMLGIR